MSAAGGAGRYPPHRALVPPASKHPEPTCFRTLRVDGRDKPVAVGPLPDTGGAREAPPQPIFILKRLKLLLEVVFGALDEEEQLLKVHSEAVFCARRQAVRLVPDEFVPQNPATPPTGRSLIWPNCF